jgi:hypothetical protein
MEMRLSTSTPPLSAFLPQLDKGVNQNAQNQPQIALDYRSKAGIYRKANQDHLNRVCETR